MLNMLEEVKPADAIQLVISRLHLRRHQMSNRGAGTKKLGLHASVPWFPQRYLGLLLQRSQLLPKSRND